MNKIAILMPSVTHAMNAKRLFSSMGYRCDIKRAVNISKNGCTHYISVNLPADRAVSLLDRNGIRHGELLKGHDDALW